MKGEHERDCLDPENRRTDEVGSTGSSVDTEALKAKCYKAYIAGTRKKRLSAGFALVAKAFSKRVFALGRQERSETANPWWYF